MSTTHEQVREYVDLYFELMELGARGIIAAEPTGDWIMDLIKSVRLDIYSTDEQVKIEAALIAYLHPELDGVGMRIETMNHHKKIILAGGAL